ncbi:DUF1016 N-terminal domain-containing protein [Brasilonema sennae]|uniref:DUF1016 N-terminal domain-containing protein n=1 Tax=Brasilonema sennae TaxID=1397703 RepID=UPI001FE296FD|nr:DUF1016 N-terminal domain-containing protein [Brasilonema sennae]
MADKLSPMDGYDDFLRDLKERIRSAQVKAALSVNRELVLLYWQIGREIIVRQQQQGWGAKVIERLARDLKAAFPDMKGFSRTNLLYMRAFAEAYPDQQIVQQVVGQIPWGHNVRILDAVKDSSAKLWYVQKTIENGWSRNILMHQTSFDLCSSLLHKLLMINLPQVVAEISYLNDSYVLTPGRYVGAEEVEDDEVFEEKILHLTKKLGQQFEESARLETAIRENLRRLGYGK